jgi:hypothetical protein
LLLSFGVVDDGEALLDDAAPLEGVELDDAFASDEAGGVPDIDDEDPVPDAEVDGLVDADPVGVELVEGVDDDDDDDGDGVTVGGDVVLLVDVSRLQPATPRTSPAQSSVTNVVFISDPPVSVGLSHGWFSRFNAIEMRAQPTGTNENAESNQACLRSTTSRSDADTA